MPTNRALVYAGNGRVELREFPMPRLEMGGRFCEHCVIIKVLLSGIGGCDLHVVRGKTPAEPGSVLGREITGEVLECGPAVEFIQPGDLVSVPFNIACGSCGSCRMGRTELCVRVGREEGGTYGLADKGVWLGGQAEYVIVPYADFNLLKFPDRARAEEKLEDLSLLSDVLPTAYHAASLAGVGPGSTVYVAGAGPIGLSAALCSLDLMGAGRVILGDPNDRRLQLARRLGCATVDVDDPESVPDQVADHLGVPQVDSVIDAVGYEARERGEDRPDSVLRLAVRLCRPGGRVCLAGVYISDNPAAPDARLRRNVIGFPWGEAWEKSLTINGGQCPASRYNRRLMEAILFERIHPARALNLQLIRMEDAQAKYQEFEQGSAEKLVIDMSGSRGGILSAGEPEAQLQAQ